MIKRTGDSLNKSNKKKKELHKHDSVEEDVINNALEWVPKERLGHLGLLGKGAFGLVTLERDTQSDKLYALKTMSKGRICHERLKEMVRNEVGCMHLLDSSFIVCMCGTYRDHQNVYILLQPCFGG